MDNKIIVILGPTATGKTKLSTELATEFDGEIISADSMQIYKKMDIGTAKVTEAEKQNIKHHMVDFIEPTEEFTLSDYIAEASKFADDILSRGKTPFLVGGTGLYISSFIENIKLSEAKTDLNYRNYLFNLAEQNGLAEVREMLKDIDPESYERIHENDIKRIIRALEIYNATGKTITEQNILSKQQPSPYKFYIIGLNYSNRGLLYDCINKRVDDMLENKLIDEVKSLNFSKLSKTAKQAIGYKEIYEYLCGNCTLNDAVETVKRESRRYAKRQLTWFKRINSINWANIDEKPREEILKYFIKDIAIFKDICYNKDV